LDLAAPAKAATAIFKLEFKKNAFWNTHKIIHSPADQHGCVSDGTITNAVVLIIVAAIVVVPA
jgi:hypothetical protein